MDSFIAGLLLLIILVGTAYIYRRQKLRSEFAEIKKKNKDLYDKISREISTHVDDESLYMYDDDETIALRIYSEYRRGLKIGLSIKQIYKHRRKNCFGPYPPR